MNKKKGLLIVESPTKAAHIQQYVGSDYIVEASVGHCIDLPSKGLGIDIGHNFTPTYEVISNKKSILKMLEQKVTKVEELILATDNDREGEAMASLLTSHLAKSGMKVSRIRFNEITKKAILNALNNRGTIDENLVSAQQTRRILDRLVGFKISPLLWQCVGNKLSAGRVQSIALHLICERQREIDSFVSEEYWTVHGFYKTSKKDEIEAEVYLKDKINKIGAEKVKYAIEKATSHEVSNVTKKQVERKASALFKTSTLQQAASNIYGWGAGKTMTIAQQLYEGVIIKGNLTALITYHRTDSVNISDDALNAVRSYIPKYGPSYLPITPNIFQSSKGAQLAHEGIRPVDVFIEPDSIKSDLTVDQMKLYDLIWRKFVASQMVPAQYESLMVEISSGHYILKTSGSTLKFDGYTKVYSYDNKKDMVLPSLSKGDKLTLLKVDANEHHTKPPGKYGTASLVKLLEDQGIGRPSTYATIISTLKSRKYVELDGKSFAPTILGKRVDSWLTQNFPTVMKVDYTANLENRLDLVSEGKEDWLKVLENFYEVLDKELKIAANDAKTVQYTKYVCPKCGSPLILRTQKATGEEFYGCSHFGDKQNPCKHVMDVGKDGKPVEKKNKILSQSCPQCGGAMEEKHGRYGTFYGCVNYPKCKQTADKDGNFKGTKAPPQKINEKCPQCNGQLILRAGKRGKFVGCSNYPRCRYTCTVENPSKGSGTRGRNGNSKRG